MNRKEYMNALENALQPLPEETRQAALEFYGEMLDDRMEDGLDEAAAVAAMETTEEIAARLGADKPAEPAASSPEKTDQPEGEASAPPMQDESMMFSSLAEQVMQSVRQAVEGVPELVNAGMKAAEKGVEEASRQIEQAAEQMEQAAERMEAQTSDEGTDGAYTKKVFTCPADQVRAVALYALDMPIRVEPCEGDTLTLRYYTTSEYPYTLTFENGVLTLRHPDRSFRGGFSLERLGGLFRIAWNRPTPTVSLEMPADAFVDLMAHTTNGSIKAGSFSALCAVDLKTSNSRIELTDTVCKTLDMESSNGRLVLRKVESKQRLRCKTSNSRIEAEKTRGGEGVTLHTSNGRIQASDVTAKGDLDIKTSNGSISVENVQAARVALKSSNGGISGVLPGRQADWAIDSGTSNGHNSLPKSQPGQRPLSVHTSNGSISLRFQET